MDSDKSAGKTGGGCCYGYGGSKKPAKTTDALQVKTGLSGLTGSPS